MSPRVDPKQIQAKDCQKAMQELQKFRDKPDKLIKEVDRRCRKAEIPVEWRQTGSHVICQTPTGDAIIPNHGEIPKGTFGSIIRMLVALGIALIILGCGAWYYIQTHIAAIAANGGG